MKFVIQESLANYRLTRKKGLTHNHIHQRMGKRLILDNNVEVTDFINCSYLGLDTHPDVVDAGHSVQKSLGTNFCCARTRLSEKNLDLLEAGLKELFRGNVVTFPSVTATHMSVMPLIASGILINPESPPNVHMVFDRFAHASMQFLVPILEKECRVSVLPHNDLEQLKKIVCESRELGEVVVYVADGIYSMGGVCPIQELLEMANEEDFYLYIDDAHGTSIFGEKGEGPVIGQIQGKIPKNLFVTFSLTKGFGVAGGGIVVSEAIQEELIRTYGLVYAFSAPLDYSATLAAIASLKLHMDGTVRKLQNELRRKVRLFDDLMDIKQDFSPIRMVDIGDEQAAILTAEALLAQGFFVVVAFFPVVPRGKAQLRLCISVEHTDSEILSLVCAIRILTERTGTKELSHAH